MFHVTEFDSPGIEPVPLPDETILIGGRAESWEPCAPAEDEPFEPTIIRGRE
ncbi:MAG TPA: hypothetical protein VFV67_07610 [Actinophytocola sp.]|uniref:hypothetical protein n=1 Tax=Actinophytocola sp. TaxID=1872138 RepID=UPI002DBA6427|nr:hypothetical protein [Actinophytocola sp.]HEU5470504.1 hypothetical protein [Actinophytocola sp.]